MKTEITRLEVKWTISRGRDTYGYNICSLWTRAGKVSSCMGGGYDMLGTALGDYIQGAYQKELQTFFIAHKDSAVEYGVTHHARLQLPDYYGMTMHADGRVSLDGGCGYQAMVRIIEALGLQHEYSVNKRGHIVAIYITEVQL